MSILFLWCGKNITIFNWIVEKCCKITGPHFLSYFHTLFLLERELQAIFTKVFHHIFIGESLKLFSPKFLSFYYGGGRELAIFMQVFTLFWSKNIYQGIHHVFLGARILRDFCSSVIGENTLSYFHPGFHIIIGTGIIFTKVFTTLLLKRDF